MRHEKRNSLNFAINKKEQNYDKKKDENSKNVKKTAILAKRISLKNKSDSIMSNEDIHTRLQNALNMTKSKSVTNRFKMNVSYHQGKKLKFEEQMKSIKNDKKRKELKNKSKND